MKIFYIGAEAILYLKKESGKKILVKERIKKGYRIKEIDLKLRKFRTRREARLLKKSSFLISVPKVLKVDEKKFKIFMEFIEGERLREIINKLSKKEMEKICFEIGKIVGKLHSNDIIHGDLTTSNMILFKRKIYLVDFGLGFFSNKVEDKAVDLSVLKETLKSTHYKFLKVCWTNIVKGYKKEYKDADKILRRLDEIEKRGRYIQRNG
ncbi:MAG: Kae1-associated kinase Bud32 [Candidatus Aenigmarchaeota archaeon ex4484_224]|nr:MAG: Kae1-associated kinase Bud32 [Candidatus Aenigmarchaeota archaeon ex4484_224]